ncbi:MAG: hypothetical protein ACFHXK_02740 [bacterium]
MSSHAEQPHRTFHMGFAYQPHDWNEEAFEYAFTKVAEYGDLIGVFFDAYVPWQEAYEKKPYHPVQEHEIQKRINGVRQHKNLLLGLSILGGDRVSLAGNLGVTDEPRRGRWQTSTFDDPHVIAAYLNYCRDMIKRFDPDYFVYVMEVDAGLTEVHDPRFQSLLNAIKQIYPVLKREFPDLPILLEFMLENDEEMQKRKGVVEALLPYSDYYAVSSYPFLMTGGDPADIPADWFSRAREIAPDKPFAIVEGNHLAENFYHAQLGVALPGTEKKLLIPGNEKWQADYIELLLSEAQKMEAVFVLQWNIRDLDQLTELLRGGGSMLDPEVEPFAALATDCGLFDEHGRARPASKVWKKWLGLPRVRNPS